MATEIAKLKRKRTTKRNTILNKTFVEVDSLINEDPRDVEERNLALSARLEFLVEAVADIKKWDEAIVELIEDDEEAQQDGNKAVDFNLKVSGVIKSIERFMRKQQWPEQSKGMGLGEMDNRYGRLGEDSQSYEQKYGSREDIRSDSEVDHQSIKGNRPDQASRKIGVKLPKYKMKTFDGEFSEWSTFIENFEAAVDAKEDLTAIEKFTYLRGYLEGDALECIKGFPLTNRNYAEALSLLKERYGNAQIIISTHMNKLINLEKVGSCNVTELRRLYDKIENNVRALSTVGIDKNHYGPLLVPIVCEKKYWSLISCVGATPLYRCLGSNR